MTDSNPSGIRLALGLACCLAAGGQVGPPAFEVASVKLNTGPRDYIDLGTAEHGKLTLHNASMKDCIRYAYGLASNEQIAGPEWTGGYDDRFEIVAKAPVDTPEEDLRRMLQSLLAERFHLTMHRESRSVPHLDLEVAKGGSKLPASPEEPAAPRYIWGRGLLNYTHQTMDDVALLLSRQLKQLVFNRTALAGFYDVRLQWRPEDPVPRDPNAAAPPPSNDSRPELAEALAQLGLKLTASKAPVIVVVIDHVDRVPAAN